MDHLADLAGVEIHEGIHPEPLAYEFPDQRLAHLSGTPDDQRAPRGQERFLEEMHLAAPEGIGRIPLRSQGVSLGPDPPLQQNVREIGGTHPGGITTDNDKFHGSLLWG